MFSGKEFQMEAPSNSVIGCKIYGQIQSKHIMLIVYIHVYNFKIILKLKFFQYRLAEIFIESFMSTCHACGEACISRIPMCLFFFHFEFGQLSYNYLSCLISIRCQMRQNIQKYTKYKQNHCFIYFSLNLMIDSL